MASAEILARMCAGSMSFDNVGGGCASADRLSRDELPALLAGLSEPAVLLAYARYMQDESVHGALINVVIAWAIALAKREQWKVDGSLTVGNLAMVAVYEHIKPGTCPKCNGRGMMMPSVKRHNFATGKSTGVGGVVVARTCTHCGGSGFKALSGRAIADAIGVDESNYRRAWRARYDQVYQYLQGLSASINWALINNDKRK